MISIRLFAASILMLMAMDIYMPSAISPSSSMTAMSGILSGVAGHRHHMHIHHHHKHVHEHKHKMLLKHKHKHEHDAKLSHKHEHDHHHRKHHKHDHHDHDDQHEQYDSDVGRRNHRTQGPRIRAINNKDDKFDMKDFNFLTKSDVTPMKNVAENDRAIP